eukprot:2113341-Rhodomonas_salina.2
MAYGAIHLRDVRYWDSVCCYVPTKCLVLRYLVVLSAYAMCGTDLLYVATMCCAMSGTDLLYAATICYAMSSTDLAYAATSAPLLPTR